jgi:hypothetical protein
VFASRLPRAAPTSRFYYIESGEGAITVGASATAAQTLQATSIVNYDAYSGLPSPLAAATTLWAAPFVATCSWTLTKIANACTP